ncbi:hypothetical protein CPB83DRAFT_842691 [Crepidotus variabilis]|uniref:F-box domain-containing protein n=1 Tax=Crepidotus variabilis TaxID=179855 RepID=A0A9P6ERB1_9AGAR|nr:hypothetical protein CPB83DRAFT_842691 [Crepidotus variabilis]
MERRSARLRDAPVKIVQYRDNEDDDAADMDVDAQLVATSSKTPAKSKGKKRKLSEEPNTAHAPSKKLRGKRGILKDLVEMPMDILFEIFNQLEPVDLLHLSRTTKAFRNILMSKASASVWKSSFENLDPPLPDCPSDLSEPAYADLAVGKNCYFCGRHTSSMHIAWQCRFRTCSKCIDDHFTDNRHHVGDGYPAKVADVLPSVTLLRYNGRYSRWKTFYLRDRDSAWRSEYDNLGSKEEREEWCSQKIADADILRTHSNLCVNWVKNRTTARERDKESAIDERRAIVVEHLRKMGWGDEYDKIPENSPKPQYMIEVTRACSKALTDRVLNNLEPCLEKFMENLQQTRIDKERQEFLQARLVALRDTYENYLTTLPCTFNYPNTSDIFQLPIIRDIINDDSTPGISGEHIDRLVDAFPAAVESWKDSVRKHLLNIIVDSLPKDEKTTPTFEFDPDTILNEASTFFHCKECNRELPTRDIPMHPCCRIFRSWGWIDSESNVEDLALRTSLKETRWNAIKNITFHPKLATRVSLVLKHLGYDPKIVSVDDLDKQDPVVECLRCHSERKGRFTAKWHSLPMHLQYEDGHDLQKHFRLVQEPQASVVRQRIAEKRASTFADSNSFDAVCGHCREKGSYSVLLAHTRTGHNITRPKLGEDIIANPHTYPSRDYRDVHILWPPLPQEDVDELMAN